MERKVFALSERKLFFTTLTFFQRQCVRGNAKVLHKKLVMRVTLGEELEPLFLSPIIFVFVFDFVPHISSTMFTDALSLVENIHKIAYFPIYIEK